MKRVLLLLALLAALAGLVALLVSPPGDEWTTVSEEALREFELGLEARMKYYTPDALRHFRKAVEFDSDFVAARLYLANYEPDWEAQDALRESLRNVETDTLTPRERFLLEFNIAQWDRETDEAWALVEAYTETHPDDAYGLATLAELLWEDQEWDEAERLYQEILRVDPNWVTARNRLGYIALAQGRFEEAEEQFVTYGYIAPDQANPHDSMGELLTLLGRYDEAEAELARALEIRPDFCNSYQHQIDLVLMRGELEAAENILETASAYCDARMIQTLRCSVEIWGDFLSGDAENVWSEDREDCRRELGDYNFLVHRTAAITGRLRIAEKAERGLERRIDAAEQAHHMRLDFPRALLAHMVGTRLAAEERFEEATEAFLEADGKLLYWGQGQGILKLYNQVNLALTQRELGFEEAAQETFERVRAVNPAFADYFQDADDEASY